MLKKGGTCSACTVSTAKQGISSTKTLGGFSYTHESSMDPSNQTLVNIIQQQLSKVSAWGSSLRMQGTEHGTFCMMTRCSTTEPYGPSPALYYSLSSHPVTTRKQALQPFWHGSGRYITEKKIIWSGLNSCSRKLRLPCALEPAIRGLIYLTGMSLWGPLKNGGINAWYIHGVHPFFAFCSTNYWGLPIYPLSPSICLLTTFPWVAWQKQNLGFPALSWKIWRF